MEQTRSKKDWMKNVIIIFLTIMLLLTLFSNTITNYSLPQVSTTTIKSGTITPKLRGTGTVESGSAYKVKAVETRNIQSVLITQGDHVDIGTELFALVDIESTELTEAQNALDKSETEYIDALFAADITPETVEKVRAGKFDSIDTLTAQVASKQQEINACQGELYSLQNQKAIKDLTLTIFNDKPEWTTMTYDEKKAWLDLEIKNMGYDSSILTDEQKLILNEKADWDALVAQYKADLAAKGKTVSDEFEKYDREMKEKYTNAANEIRDRLLELDIEILNKDKASATLATEDEVALNNAKIAENNAKNAQAAERSKLKTEADQIAAQYNAVESRLKILSTEKEDLLKDIKAQLGLKNKAEDIVKQREKVEKLIKKSTGAVITAPIAGTIQTLNVVSGAETKAGDELCVIVPDGMDMTVTINVDSKQANKIKLGDEGTLANSWNYQDVVALVSKIADDTTNPGKTNITFTVTGDSVKIGQSLTISVGSLEKQYDTIVTKAAVNKDQGGNFVYKLNVKSSPLGNRYIAERVPVEVKDEDDNNIYITGDIEQGDYVITSSNKMVEAGKQVRLSESSN